MLQSLCYEMRRDRTRYYPTRPKLLGRLCTRITFSQRYLLVLHTLSHLYPFSFRLRRLISLLLEDRMPSAHICRIALFTCGIHPLLLSRTKQKDCLRQGLWMASYYTRFRKADLSSSFHHIELFMLFPALAGRSNLAFLLFASVLMQS